MKTIFGKWVRCSITIIPGLSWIFHITSTILFSPLHSPMKRAQLETGHRSSISDRHQYKHQGIMDSPPFSSSEEDIPSHGPKSWLPPKQSTNESLPEFRGRPHQHRPTINEHSTFRPPVQHQSARIPISRVLSSNTYGDSPPIYIKHDLEQGLVPIQKEPITVEQPAPTPTDEEDDIGIMYSQQWILLRSVLFFQWT